MINVDFEYVSNSGAKFSDSMQCNNYDDADCIIDDVMKWCEQNSFRMKRISIIGEEDN